MEIHPIRTRVVHPPKDNIFEVIAESISTIVERSILVITSKVISIHQGRCVPASNIDRDDLAIREADWFLPRKYVPGRHILLTLKYHSWVASSGIDASNGNGYWILWPKDPMKLARELYDFVQKHFHVKEFGVLICDSHSIPFRRGTVGFSLAHCGFSPVRDYRGSLDIFSEPLKVTISNYVDGLAAAAVVVMGESGEQTPLALISEHTHIQFSEDPQEISGNPLFHVPLEDDLYAELFTGKAWKKGSGGISEKEIRELKE